MEIIRKPAWFMVVTIIAVLGGIWVVDAYGFRNPFSAFLINILAMSWVALIGQVVHISFSPGYYAIKDFERTGQIYENLGVHFFKRLVRRGPLTFFSPTLRFPKEKTLSGLQYLNHEMEKAEAGHILIFLVMLFFSGYALFRAWFDAAGWMLLFNVLINGYPVMLQRYNRIKLRQLIQS